MKRFLITCIALVAISAAATAQEPTTQWPYLYPEFRTGIVSFADGQSQSYQLNVHLRRAGLHFLDSEGIIKEADISKVSGAQIGQEPFLKVNGEMMRVAAQSAHGCVAEEVLGDFAALTETGGAYGVSSTTAATRKLSSIETDSQINQNHMLLMQSRSNGKMLSMLKAYWLVYPGNVVKATRGEVEKIIPADRKADWKAWKKAHNIKWNDPESMVNLLEFLNP